MIGIMSKFGLWRVRFDRWAQLTTVSIPSQGARRRDSWCEQGELVEMQGHGRACREAGDNGALESGDVYIEDTTNCNNTSTSTLLIHAQDQHSVSWPDPPSPNPTRSF
jgi:hypothetical protein